ncbi:hypothetical protein RUND412_007220 [Rhizina undulata]
MQRTVFSYFIFTLTVLCAFTHADAASEPLFMVPSTTNNSPTHPTTWTGVLRRNVNEMLRRRDTTTSTSTVTTDTGARNETAVEQLNLQQWATNTTIKCMEKLANVTQASNPAGIAVCYNLPFLSTDSGVFAADLRLYQVSAPEGDWASVGGNIDVSLMYDGAAVQLRNETTGEVNATDAAAASTTGPQKVQEFQFVGQIDQQLLSQSLTDPELQAMLTPKISLVAQTSNGTMLNTTLSTDDATFINGVFSNLVATSAAAASASAAADTAFVLPGTKISIVPVGLYFYSAYSAVAFLVFGWGTFERQKFREQYRKRVALMGAQGGGNRAI